MQRPWNRPLVRMSVLGVVAGIIVASILVVGPKSRAALASPAPGLTVNGYLAPGNTVQIEGGGFTLAGTVALSYDNTLIGTMPVNQRVTLRGTSGAGFTTTFSVPVNTTTGVHTFSAVQAASGLSTQLAVTVNANWAQYGFTAAGTRNNPYETAISPSNVSSLTPAWTFTDTNTPIEGNFGYKMPSIYDGNLYVASSGDDYMFGLNATTGKLLWSSNINYPLTSSNPGQPALAGKTLFDTGYLLYAVNIASGAATTPYAQPPLLDAPTYADGILYVSDSGSLDAFSAAACSVSYCTPLWTYTAGYDSITGIPSVANGTVYVGTQFGQLVALDAATGALEWTATVGGTEDYADNPVVDDGTVFIDFYNSNNYTTTLYAFDASGCGSSTCSPVWSGAVGQLHEVEGPTLLAVGDGDVFASSTDSSLYAFAESGCGSSTCSPLWKGLTGGEIVAPPTVANGVVYVGSYDDNIYAFNAAGCAAATCGSLWKYNLDNESLQSSPIVVNGMLYATSLNNVLYAFSLPGTSVKGGPTTTRPNPSPHPLRPHGILPTPYRPVPSIRTGTAWGTAL